MTLVLFIHKKELLRPVKVLEPDPRWGQIILEQYAGADSEATALNTYLTQRFNTNLPEIRDLLEDIGTEEISHWEMVAELARQHGVVVKMRDAAGNPWSSTYTDVSGNIITKVFPARHPEQHLHTCNGEDTDVTKRTTELESACQATEVPRRWPLSREHDA